MNNMFSFNTPKTASGFTLPATATSTTSVPLGGGAGDNKLQQQQKPATNLFGTPVAGAQTTGFSLGAAVNKTTAAPTLNFASPATTAPTTGFSLGAAPVSTATSTPQFSFGGLGTAASTASIAPTSAAASTTAASSFTPIFGTSTAALTLGLSLGAKTTADSGLKLSASATPTTATTTASSGFSLSTSLTSTSSAAPTSASATTTTTAATSLTGQLSYAQLDDSISKWSIDLEELCKFFINQSKQLNAWDRLLLGNGEKISALNDTIQRVKQQQKQLDQELDFVHAQQNELDELSAPLDKQLSEIPVVDQNRYQMYQLSENIDSQLKQMSEDLKEVIEQLNDSNKEEDLSDPINQLSKILNAQMNTLQWIDRKTSQITTHLDQIGKVQELNKKNKNL